MANSKKSSSSYKIALLNGGAFVAIAVVQETKDSFVGRVYGVGRNANDTGYTFAPVRFFKTPTIYKHNIVFVEDMPKEMEQAYLAFLSAAQN